MPIENLKCRGFCHTTPLEFVEHEELREDSFRLLVFDQPEPSDFVVVEDQIWELARIDPVARAVE